MRKLIGSSFIAVCCLAVPLFAASPAQAGLDVCGDIHVEANAKCELGLKGCEAECTPFTVQAACAAEGYASCSGECDFPAIECSGSCEADCGGKCEGNKEFTCEGHCSGSCDADCQGQCATSGNKGECEAQCKATCQGECTASCKGAPVTCEGKCSGSCQGQCKAKRNMTCQATCQGELAVECKGRIEGGCKVACQSPEGAMFCNGQYVDHNGNAQACWDAITAWRDKIVASVNFEASAKCANGKCEASASCGNTVANKSLDGSAPYALGLVGALGALAFARYRRRQK